MSGIDVASQMIGFYEANSTFRTQMWPEMEFEIMNEIIAHQINIMVNLPKFYLLYYYLTFYHCELACESLERSHLYTF